MKNLFSIVRFGVVTVFMMSVSAMLLAGATKSGPFPPPPLEDDIVKLQSGPFPPPPLEDDIVKLMSGPFPPPPLEDDIAK